MKIGIIGAGPAGISVALQLKRFGFNPIIFEKEEVGGVVKEAYMIFNFLGYPSGISGKNFVKKMKETVRRNNLKIIFEEIKGVRFENKFILKANKIFKFDILVIASGTYKKPLPPFDNFFTNSITNLKKIKNLKIGILGGSDVAFDYALSLKNAKEVFIFHKGEKPKAIKDLRDRVFSLKNVRYLNNLKFLEIKRLKNSLQIIFEKNEKAKKFDLNHLINATGRLPDKRFYEENFTKLEGDLIKKGILYLAGDVAHPSYRQISIALGDGLLTAQKIYEKIKSL